MKSKSKREKQPISTRKDHEDIGGPERSLTLSLLLSLTL